MNWYGSMVVGLIIRHLYFRKLIFYNFSKIFKFGYKLIGWNQFGLICSALLYNILKIQ